MQQVILTGPVTAKKFYIAAALCRRTLDFRFNPKEDPHHQLGLDYTRQAIACGWSRKELENCPYLKDWARQLAQEEIAVAPTSNDPTLDRLIDPLQGSLD
jgi:hypothetical protein